MAADSKVKVSKGNLPGLPSGVFTKSDYLVFCSWKAASAAPDRPGVGAGTTPSK